MKHPNLTTQSYVFNFASELMTEVNGTLFVSGYREEPVESHECRATVTITTERTNVVEAQNASAKTFDVMKKALSAAKSRVR